VRPTAVASAVSSLPWVARLMSVRSSCCQHHSAIASATFSAVMASSTRLTSSTHSSDRHTSSASLRVRVVVRSAAWAFWCSSVSGGGSLWPRRRPDRDSRTLGVEHGGEVVDAQVGLGLASPIGRLAEQRQVVEEHPAR